MPRYKVKHFNLFICVLLFLCNILLSNNITGATNKTKIIIRGDKEYAPYEFLNNNGKPDGFNVDLIKAVMKEMKIEYDLQLIGWRDCLANFNTDDVDIITSAIEFSDDQETSLFSFPTQKTNFVSVCRKEFRPFSTETLKDLNIIIREGSFCDSILKEKLKKVITVDNLCYGLTMLDRGRGDALIGDESVVKYYIRQNSLKNLEIRTLSLPENRLRFAIKKDSTSLRDSVNAGLERIMKNGTYDSIYSKWFGLESNEETTKSDNYLFILYLSGVIIIIFLGFIIILLRRIKSIKRSFQNSHNDDIINIHNKNTILDSLPCCIAIYDKDLRQQYINQPIADVFGITNIKEHLAKHVYIADNTQLTEQEQILVKKGVDFEIIKEYDMNEVLKNKYFETNHSNKIHLNCKVRNLRDSSGNITSVVFLLTDVTDLKLKSQKLSLYKDQLTMALAAGKMDVWEYDIKSDKVTILYSYNNAAHIFTFEEALSLIHPKERHIFRAEIEKLKSGKILNTQCITRNFNHITEKYEYLQKNIQAQHGNNGNIAKIIGVSYNVNELYEHELELNSLLSSLSLSMKTSMVSYYSFLLADMSVQKFIENKFVTIFNSIEELYKYIHPDDCFDFRKTTVQLYNCKPVGGINSLKNVRK